MEGQQILQCRWMAYKLMLVSLGPIFMLVGLEWGSHTISHVFGFSHWVVYWIMGCLVSFVRTIFEQYMVYEVEYEHIDKIQALWYGAINASLLTLVLVFIKEPLGTYAIPVSLIVIHPIFKGIRTWLLPHQITASSIFNKLDAKRMLFAEANYTFYGVCGLLGYLGAHYLHLGFFVIFMGACCIALLVAARKEVYQVYNESLNVVSAMMILGIIVLGSLCFTILAIVLMNYCSLRHKPAIVISAIGLKFAFSTLVPRIICKDSGE